MDTDQSVPPTEELDDGPGETPAQHPGIAHLTVVPENADRSA